MTLECKEAQPRGKGQAKMSSVGQRVKIAKWQETVRACGEERDITLGLCSIH